MKGQLLGWSKVRQERMKLFWAQPATYLSSSFQLRLNFNWILKHEVVSVSTKTKNRLKTVLFVIETSKMQFFNSNEKNILLDFDFSMVDQNSNWFESKKTWRQQISVKAVYFLSMIFARLRARNGSITKSKIWS